MWFEIGDTVKLDNGDIGEIVAIDTEEEEYLITDDGGETFSEHKYEYGSYSYISWSANEDDDTLCRWYPEHEIERRAYTINEINVGDEIEIENTINLREEVRGTVRTILGKRGDVLIIDTTDLGFGFSADMAKHSWGFTIPSGVQYVAGLEPTYVLDIVTKKPIDLGPLEGVSDQGRWITNIDEYRQGNYKGGPSGLEFL